MVLYCFKCHQEVAFDAEHIGKNGKKIPLDPTSRRPHDCPEREKPIGIKLDNQTIPYPKDKDDQKPQSFGTGEDAVKMFQEEKDDHGNEEYASLSERNKDPLEYVDHTVARPSKVKIFHAENSDLVELAYNEFLKSKTFQWTRAQLGSKGNEFVIALYYEETK